MCVFLAFSASIRSFSICFSSLDISSFAYCRCVLFLRATILPCFKYVFLISILIKSHLWRISVVWYFCVAFLISLSISFLISTLFVRLELHLIIPGPYFTSSVVIDVYKKWWSLSLGYFVTYDVVMCGTLIIGVKI